MISLGKMFPFLFGNLGKKNATVLYPKTKCVPYSNFRGKLKFDQSTCIGCKLCMKDCPANAIEITNDIEKGEKVYQAELYLDRCLYCAQCVKTCPKNSLECTTEFELANFNRKDMKVKI